MSREIVRSQATMVQLGTMDATQRIADFLLDLADRLRARGFSASALMLRMRRSELACYFGLELETVCRVLSKLQAAGLLRIAQREIHITDRDGLARRRDGTA
jgi:CRP/FNR family transcriptional regulator